MSVAPPLPRRLRTIAIVSAMMSGAVGLSAGSEAMGLSRLGDLRGEAAGRTGFVEPHVWQAMIDAQISALEGMKEPRQAVLAFLSLGCALTLVASVRLLSPGILPREGMRRMLGWATILAAGLRTIDGAQGAVIFRRAAAAGAKAMAASDVAAEGVASMAPTLAMGMEILRTLVVVGTFVALSSYFRSEGVRNALAAAD